MINKSEIAEFARRFKALREALNLNQDEIAAKMGVHLQTISRYERGEGVPSGKKLSVLAENTGANPHWLLTGKGEMFLKLPIPEAIPLPRIPVLGRVPAGFPEHFEEEVIEYISPPHASQGTYGLIVKGESMTPTLKDGDYVLFIADGDYKNGDVVVVNDEWGESMVKRYKAKPDGDTWVTSDNPEYPSFKPNEHWRIVGKVVDVWRRIKL